jgi:hypothetical protein
MILIIYRIVDGETNTTALESDFGIQLYLNLNNIVVFSFDSRNEPNMALRDMVRPAMRGFHFSPLSRTICEGMARRTHAILSNL